MSTSQQQVTVPNPRNEDEALEALERETEEADRREEEEARRQADERARRQAERREALKRARAEAEEKRKKEEEEQKKKAEEERRQRELDKEEQRRREAQAKEEEEAKKRKRDKGKGKAKEVEVMSLDDEDEDDEDDDDDDRWANRAYVEVPTTSRPTKKRRVGEKVRLGGDWPCQWCIEVGRVCKVHPSSTVTKCLACTSQKLRCEAANGGAPQSSGLTLRIGPSKVARERESKDLQEVLDQLATLQAELAIEREARRQERGRLLDVVEHVAMGAFGTRDVLRRLEDCLEFAGKIGPWEEYAREKERLEEEEERKDEEKKKKKEEEEKARERMEKEDRGEGPSAPSS